MEITLHRWLLLVSLSNTLATNNPHLPLCPTNLQYFPQNLPMHCRMPRNADPGSFPGLPQYPTLPPLPESFYQSPSPDKMPPPVPIPIPPFPGMPGGMPMPGPMGPAMGPVPGMPGPMPIPMPMVGGPAHKLPVIVMPFYSPDSSFKKSQPPQKPHHGKKKRPHKKKKPPYNSDTDTSSEETSSGSDDSNNSDEHGFWRGHKKSRRKMTRRLNKQQRMRRKETRNKKKDLLTPILQYVTKDGYVIFEKQISKSEANDWLKTKPDMNLMDEKHKEKDDKIRPKSAEESPKLDVGEINMKAIEKSEEAMRVETTTKKGNKHRLKKGSALRKKTMFSQISQS